MHTTFQWLSSHGISVILFLLCGLLYFVIGVLTPFLINSGIGSRALIITNRTDAVVFGEDPGKILDEDPRIFTLRTILLRMIGGMLAAIGIFQLAITWFGLRAGETWALAALAIGGVLVLPFWFFALKPYIEKTTLTLADIPPFMWVPAALLLPAVILGYTGLR